MALRLRDNDRKGRILCGSACPDCAGTTGQAPCGHRRTRPARLDPALGPNQKRRHVPRVPVPPVLASQLSRLHRFGRTGLATLGLLVGYLAFAACSSSIEAGIATEISLTLTPADPDEPRQWETDLGYRVEVDAAYLGIAAVEIVGCEAQGLLELSKRSLGPRSARAHGTSTPTRIANPLVVSLVLDEETTFGLGTAEPPPGDYCEIDVELGAIDSDASGLPLEPDIVGLSLYASGTWTAEDGETGSFLLTTDRALEREIGIDATLSATEQSLAISLRAALRRAFDGVDFRNSSEGNDAEQILANLAAALTVSVE